MLIVSRNTARKQSPWTHDCSTGRHRGNTLSSPTLVHSLTLIAACGKPTFGCFWYESGSLDRRSPVLTRHNYEDATEVQLISESTATVESLFHPTAVFSG